MACRVSPTSQRILRSFPHLALVIGLSAAHAPAGDELLVSSFSSSRVGRYDRFTGAYLGALDPGAGLVNPQAIAMGPDGQLYVASEGTNSVLRYDATTFAFLNVFVAAGSGGLNGPTGLLFDSSGDLLVASFETDEVLRFNGVNGALIGPFVAAGSGGLDGPDIGMAFGADGHLYVPSYWNSQVLRYDGVTGAFIDVFIPNGSGGLTHPRTIAFRPDGYAYVSSEGSARINRYIPGTGAFFNTFVSEGVLVTPTGMAWDSAGALLVADGFSSTVHTYNGQTGAFQGNFVTSGAGGISLPTYIGIVPHVNYSSQPQFGTGSSLSLAWGDADGDGDFDLAVADSSGAGNSLWFNNGNGTFSRQALFGAGATFAITFVDLDNDGDEDAVVGKNGAFTVIYVNQGGGAFSTPISLARRRTVALACGDFDNDGDVDIAVGNGILGADTQNFLYINNGNGTYTERAEFGGLQTDSIAWGDFDNDGDLDLAVGNGGYAAAQQNALYINNGNGTFTARNEFGMGDTASVAWGDADNDGDLDLAVGNWGGDPSMLYINNGDGTFSGRQEFGSGDTNSIAWFDYDNDGDLDIAVSNGDFSSADQNYIYVNDGHALFTAVPAFGLESTDAMAMCDFDNDGDLDVAVANEHSPGINYLYTNSENDTAFLILHLVGHRQDRGAGFSNRDGVGARLWVYADGHLNDPAYLRGYRQISISGGFNPQHSIDAHFGLPFDKNVDVQIAWPGSGGSAVVQTLRKVAVGQRRIVHERPPTDGDMNCDGLVDGRDVKAFATAILSPTDYAAAYPACNILYGDLTLDTMVDLQDVAPFVSLVVTGN